MFFVEAENLKKKQELVKLREDKKTTRKAKAMATRTKDNLKVCCFLFDSFLCLRKW